MTIQEAENYYFYEVEEAKKRETTKANKTLKKILIIWNIISSVLILTGIILTVIGFTAPPEKTLAGLEMDSIGTTIEKVFGIGALLLGIFFILIIDIFLYRNIKKAIKRGQINLLPYIKNLYLNYLRCEDMKPEDKEFYKQKLEDIRISSLAGAVYGAASTASATILFSALYK